MQDANLGGDLKDNRMEFSRRNTDFRNAHMSHANMRKADFTGANFTGAILRGAKFEEALLTGANFTNAYLDEADFEGAELSRAIFSGAQLTKAKLTGAVLEWTMFDAVDLSSVIGLELVEHRAPSAVTLATVYRSGGLIPDEFLFGTQQDAPEEVLKQLRDTFRTLPFEYWSCFVSYAHQDSEFVDYLTRRLEARGVSVWKDDLSLKAGEPFAERINQAIGRYERFLIVLSAHSLNREWVRKELDEALEKKRFNILPISVDDSIFEANDSLALELRSERHVANFSKWPDQKSSREQLRLLLSALRRVR